MALDLKAVGSGESAMPPELAQLLQGQKGDDKFEQIRAKVQQMYYSQGKEEFVLLFLELPELLGRQDEEKVWQAERFTWGYTKSVFKRVWEKYVLVFSHDLNRLLLSSSIRTEP